jgi:phosphoribosylamine---glycine ligase
MRILIIGSGGREHAIGWKLVQEGHTIFAVPGNPGLAAMGSVLNTADYLAAASECSADLTVVGPEAPLVAGVVDQFRAAGRRIVGPSAEQARLEGSKIWAKQFMLEAGIPTARSVRTDSIAEGLEALAQFGLPVVIKADGLASGKGVVIAETSDDAQQAVRSLGPRLVIEEFLTGEEISFIALCDGKTAMPLEATQDHKAVFDGDRGPNTGGMGAYCDGRLLDPATATQILDSVIRPVVERTQFTGFLYAGLMMTAQGVKVLEFNVRLGDPETQALVHRMDGEFAEVLADAADHRLSRAHLDWRPEPSVCVVMAAQGYPGTPRTGDLITGIEQCGTQVFQAGTRSGPRGIETNGGRVLGVTARGPDLAAAIDNAYAAVRQIHFDGAHYRTDIGRKGLRRW